MIMYGTALLSICLLLGLTIGRMLGNLAGVDALQGGAVALLAGTLTVGASFALVGFFVKAGNSNSPAKG